MYVGKRSFRMFNVALQKRLLWALGESSKTRTSGKVASTNKDRAGCDKGR